jgi:hypothetical protein
MLGMMGLGRAGAPPRNPQGPMVAPGSPQSAGAIMEEGVMAFPRLPQQPFDVTTVYNGAFADPARFNKRIHLLWFGAGSTEGFSRSIKDGVDNLKSSGINVVYFESPGTAHEWLTWRRSLNDFVPRLFH